MSELVEGVQSRGSNVKSPRITGVDCGRVRLTGRLTLVSCLFRGRYQAEFAVEDLQEPFERGQDNRCEFRKS